MVAGVGVEKVSSDCVPDLGGFVEGTRANAISKGHIEPHAVNCIFVTLQGMHEIAAGGVPQLAGTIIAARDELVPILIEAAIGQGQHVAFQLLHQLELLLPLFLDLLDQL